MQSIKVMSLNMRNSYIQYGKHSWKNRLSAIKTLIHQQTPDIIGTQELTINTLKDLEILLPEYTWIGLGREGGTQGEFTAIFYKTHKFNLLDEETFWLSHTPHRPSKAWWAFFPRTCTTCTLGLKEDPSSTFKVYNTHLDHLSYLSRLKSLDLITQKMEQETSHPIVLMGDFNATPHSQTLKNWSLQLKNTHQKHLNSVYSILKGHLGCSYHAFLGGKKGNPIDYIFTCDNFEVDTVSIHQEKIEGRYPSDHYPIIANLALKP